MAVSKRSQRYIDAMYKYANEFKRWDSTHIIPRVKITSAANGCMEGYFEVTKDICNANDTVHGGFLSSLVDFTTFSGVATHPFGTWAYTANMQVTFLRKGLVGDVIKFHTRPILFSKKKVLMECVLTNEVNNKMVAYGNADFSIPNPVIDIMHIFGYDPTIKD